MIRVTCGACGAAFNARDEHAGRRGKCPKCGGVVQVPEPGPLDDGAESEAEEPEADERPVENEPPVHRRGRPRSGGGRRARSRRPARSQAPAWLFPTVIIAVVAIGAIFVWKSSFSGLTGGPDVERFRLGREALTRASYAEAREYFALVSPGTTMYAEAQERIVEVDELIAAAQAREFERAAETAFGNIQKLQKGWVDQLGPNDPTYSGNCRYMLKRAKEFIERYPAAKQVPEARKLFDHYRNVASLDKQPTTTDIRREVFFRKSAKSFGLALKAIDEFSTLPHAHPDTVAELEREVRVEAEAEWKLVKARIQESLVPGQENWVMVKGLAEHYLDWVQGDWALSQEAQSYYDQAKSELGN